MIINKNVNGYKMFSYVFALHVIVN
jgi:hypothetical protein